MVSSVKPGFFTTKQKAKADIEECIYRTARDDRERERETPQTDAAFFLYISIDLLHKHRDSTVTAIHNKRLCHTYIDADMSLSRHLYIQRKRQIDRYR